MKKEKQSQAKPNTTSFSLDWEYDATLNAP
jgi:hypothetical protein